jgi:hypothetical protein
MICFVISNLLAIVNFYSLSGTRVPHNALLESKGGCNMKLNTKYLIVSKSELCILPTSFGE